MKKVMLLSMIFVCVLNYGQERDTIFFKTGKFIEVYYAMGHSLGTFKYVSDEGDTMIEIDSELVERYTAHKRIKEKKEIFSIENEYFNLNKGKSELDYKTGWIQYNLGKFYKEERTSQFLYGLSFVSGIVYAAAPLKNTPFMYIGAGLGLTGFIVHLDSYKWIKRASIETTLNGVTLKVKL